MIVIHSLAHAQAALAAAQETGVRVVLASARGAGCYSGPGWFAAVIEGAGADPDQAVLDCGDEAGTALAALRHGLKRIVFRGEPEAASRLADIARRLGARVDTAENAPALDLRFERDPLASCRQLLGRNASIR